MNKRILIGLIVLIAISVGIYTVNPQVSGQKTMREILQDVFDPSNGRLMTTANVGAQGANAGLTEQEIYQAVYDPDNHLLRTSGGVGGEGSNAWADLIAGTSTGDAFVVGNGSSITPTGTGVITATTALEADAALEGCTLGQYAHHWDNQAWKMTCAQVQFSQLGGAATDAQIPNLGTLSTGLTAGRCVQTNASTGALEPAAAACGSGSGGGAWGTITGTLADQTDLQAALDAKEDSLGFTAVPNTRTVCGDPLSSDVTCTKADVGLTSVDDKSSATLHTETRTESGALNIPRTLTQADVSPIVLDPLYQRVVIAELSQATTFGVPTGTAPIDGQILELDVFSTVARATTFLTDANGFCADHDISLPSTTIAGKYVKWAFTWLDAVDCWSFFGTTQTAAAGGAAPADAAYVVTQANGSLSAEANLGALTTGVLCHTVTGSVSTPSTCVAGTDYQAPLSNVTNDAQLKRAAADFASFAAKAVPVAADLLIIEDSAAAGAKKKVQIGELVIIPTQAGLSAVTNDAQLKRAAGDFASFTEKTTIVDADIFLLEDSAAAGAKKKVTKANLLAGVSAGGTGTVQLPVFGVTLPATNAALVDRAENNSRLLFDNTTQWCAWWEFDLPTDYASTPVFFLKYSMTSVTSGSLAFDITVMAVTAGDSADANTDSYATANNCDDGTVPGTAGHMKTISCALTNFDSAAANDLMRVKICRDVATDNAAGVAEVLRAKLEYAK